ncbi:uncharacterized protein LOC133893275 [Phragmites australis]|uniref:uncharacterized protein LOC133893275 n=1 Tax=Phragmites australis TaxID=29695 RepID=UPI002D7943A4|nr:uncharacterized protein LOC133893275 [Phragmites australis]
MERPAEKEAPPPAVEDGMLSATAAMARDAAVLLQSRRYAECAEVLAQLPLNEGDPKVLHNMAITESFLEGCPDPKSLLKILGDVKVGKMLKYKQEDVCGGESSEMHRDLIDTFEEQFGDSSDSGQGVWGELSKGIAAKLSRTVFSIASFKGNAMLCACSGIVIRSDPPITTLLTSASLVRSSHGRIEDDLMIRVRYEYRQYTNGWLGDYDLDHNLLLVNIHTRRLPVAHLDHQVQLESCSKVLAVGRVFNSRKLMATSGLVKDTISIYDQEEAAVSTCKISKAGIGGPLIDVDGYFHGMNFYGEEETPFLPRSIILKCLKRFGIFGDENKGGDYTSRKMMRCANRTVDASPSCGFFSKEFVDQMHDRLRSNGFPLPTTICAGMDINNSFEEKFCKLDGSKGDFVNELSVELASTLSRSVVSLASFDGKTRWFACSGTLIEYDRRTSVLTSASLVRSFDDENKIVDNLQIEVHLPDGQCVKGTLQYCNLYYNIAVVNTLVFPDFRAANLYHPMQIETGRKVVAVGRIFSSGRLTATCGIVTGKESNFCDKLMMSTCKITKVGIGGPVVDFNGNFIGMNFYDKGETPFLPRNVILECLRHFETRGIMAAENIADRPTRWPVPEPYWFNPTIDEPTDPLLELALLPMVVLRADPAQK